MEHIKTKDVCCKNHTEYMAKLRERNVQPSVSTVAAPLGFKRLI
jgi:hypothetical protein